MDLRGAWNHVSPLPVSVIADIIRNANARARRLDKARAAYGALTFDEKGTFAAEMLRELRAGPPEKRSHRRKTVEMGASSQDAPSTPGTGAPQKPRMTIRDYVTGALSQCAPMNVAGIHAVIERTAPGVVGKHSVAAEVSTMLANGLIVKAGTDGRSASFALGAAAGANVQGGAH